MNTLFLDIASHHRFIACCTDKAVVGFQKSDERIGDADLVGLVEGILKKAKWKYADLTSIACINGPGGFTGLRVTAAFVNTLADQLNIPSAGVHMSDYYPARVDQDDFIWLHSTKKTELFVRGFGTHQKLWPDPVHIELNALLKSYPADAVWTGELLPEHREALGASQLEAGDPTTILPEFLSGISYDANPVLPWYGREW